VKSNTGKNGSVILSFDDGPAPSEALHQILSILEKNGIKAEFYLIGKEVEANPNDTKAIAEQGHSVQNHSFSHIDLSKADLAEVKRQLKDTQQVILIRTGIEPDKIRPPYGAGGWSGNLDPELVKVSAQLNLSIQNWDVDTEDWSRPRGIKMDMVKQQLIQNRGNARINILMHVQKETARDLPALINNLKDWGYSIENP